MSYDYLIKEYLFNLILPILIIIVNRVKFENEEFKNKFYSKLNNFIVQF